MRTGQSRILSIRMRRPSAARRHLVLPAVIGWWLALNSGLCAQPATPPDPTAPKGPPQQIAETPAAPTAETIDRPTLEKQFAETLSGATLTGHFTDHTETAEDGPKLRKEKYSLGEVRKLSEDRWLFPTRIQYANRDLTLPLSLRVQWAGDTPVIVLDDLEIPGLGTFSARVLFHEDHYAGYWQGADHGGHLFGQIESTPSENGDTPQQ